MHLSREINKESWNDLFVSEFLPRIKFLLEHEMNIEAFFLISTLVEIALFNTVVTLNSTDAMKGGKKTTRYSSIERLPLGDLIYEFKKYSEDHKLISRM